MGKLGRYLEESVGTLVRHCANPRCTRVEDGQIHLRYDAPTRDTEDPAADGGHQRRLRVYCTPACKQDAASRRRALEEAIRLLDEQIAHPVRAEREAPKEVLKLWRRRIKWELDGIATRTVLDS